MEAAVQLKTTINNAGVLPKGPLVVGCNWGLRAMTPTVLTYRCILLIDKHHTIVSCLNS